MDDDSLKGLMIAVQKGDQKAYSHLIDACQDILRVRLAKKIFKVEHCEDVAQEILLALHQSRHSYQPSCSFLSWFYAIVHYKIVDYIKAQSKEKQVLDSEGILEMLASVDSMKQDDKFILQDMMAHLSIDERELLRWVKLDGYRLKDVAQFLNKSDSAIKVAVHRLIKKMRYFLKKEGPLLGFFVTVWILMRIYN
ncbi:MAG: sigma-70 family RNA polymerase sigma factor [bacterium]